MQYLNHFVSPNNEVSQPNKCDLSSSLKVKYNGEKGVYFSNGSLRHCSNDDGKQYWPISGIFGVIAGVASAVNVINDSILKNSRN